MLRLTRRLRGGLKRTLSGVLVGSVAAATLTIAAPAAHAGTPPLGAPVILDTLSVLCDADVTPGLEQYARESLSKLHESAWNDNDRSIAVLGTNGSTRCHRSALEMMPDMTIGIIPPPPVSYHPVPTLDDFFDELDAGTRNPAVLWLSDLARSDTSETIELRADSLQRYLSNGGALYVNNHYYTWLDKVVPGLVHQPGGGVTNLALTEAGQEAFPDLNGGHMRAFYGGAFSGDFGSLESWIEADDPPGVGAGSPSSGVSYAIGGYLAVAPPATAPGAPALELRAITEDSATLYLTPPASDGGSPITGYTIHGDGIEHQVTGAAGGLITIPDLTLGTWYMVHAYATNAIGRSLDSNVANLLPAVPKTAPDAPTITAVTTGNRNVYVTVAAPENDGGRPIQHLTVQVRNGIHTHQLRAPAAGGGVTFSGLTNGLAYELTATATNQVGTSTASAPVQATPFTKAGAPALSGAAAGNGKVSVKVAAPKSNGGRPVTGYTVVARPGGKKVTLAGAAGGTATITGLTNGTAYTLTATAATAAGASAPSNTVKVTPFTVAAKPAAPKASKATLDTATLKVTAPRSTGGSPVKHLTVRVSGPGVKKAYTVAAKGGTVKVTGLRPGTSYKVTVVAVNAAGRSTAVTSTVKTAKAPKAVQPIVKVKGPLYPGMTAGLTGAGLFGYQSAKLTKAGRAQVVTLAKKLRSAKEIRVEGHTDGGNTKANNALGLARAKAVAKVLKAQGVKAKVVVVSRGAKKPARKTGTRAQRAVNRRVEVRVVR